MENSFEQFLQEYTPNLDNPDYLSKAIVHLSALLYNHNTQMALAELSESQAMISYLSIAGNNKKMAVSEALVRAQVDTNNSYHQMKVKTEAIIEVINSIKKRLEVLAWERKSPQY